MWKEEICYSFTCVLFPTIKRSSIAPAFIHHMDIQIAESINHKPAGKRTGKWASRQKISKKEEPGKNETDHKEKHEQKYKTAQTDDRGTMKKLVRYLERQFAVVYILGLPYLGSA